MGWAVLLIKKMKTIIGFTMLESLLKKTVLPLAALGVMVFPAAVKAQAEAEAEAETPVVYAEYEVPKGPVTLYGQELDPYIAYYESEAYTGYRWDKVRQFVPEIFPDAKENTQSAEQVCDMMDIVSLMYGMLEEENLKRLADVLKPKFPDVADDAVMMEKALSYINTRDTSALDALLKLLPDYQFQILMTRKLVMKNMAIDMLHDAAIKNCPDYADRKGYLPRSGS
ncbi:MAG: hypothetical protein CMH27_09710 [Micavibrio sp.]|nr:hypothetical protein [Micavibrio sp.]|tara:strand:- start:2374 stop:3051 length:678 start_codon:yes stop_codon:yes gene_type:complete